jgi:hypothetical protein
LPDEVLRDRVRDRYPVNAPGVPVRASDAPKAASAVITMRRGDRAAASTFVGDAVLAGYAGLAIT